MENISENLRIARQKIDDAKSISGVDHVTLVGITKTRTPEQICDLMEAGCSDIGENRVQEWEDKYPMVLTELKKRNFVGKYTRHLVGHLQSNKAKKALEDFDMIQSVDSLKLAQKLSRIADEEKLPPVKCLIQIKLGDEETKSGIGKNEFGINFELFLELESIRICGLMLIAPLWAMGEEAR
ncbi:YggS family pyridoxal phosphate-dependent enzyme, partial [bacterium]|nr:YggS family pyridoxal phosphate-dependent enzyme [bacterium]MBU1024579.1 YggS family pyridoxal phosphate-dependent enzyme [bacterium]